ncbi:VOC family protein [Streptomyces sp. TP-A0874]|uniref:VOC family protein n=1 Tax=Streptomyces sp. TP-A0874 TaxID=549819 RepID=UPI0008537320|nr:VOC family protein [Streptomyces sp. TP-A0874]
MTFTRLACASIAVPSIADALPSFTDGLGMRIHGEVRTSRRGYGLRWVELGNDNGPMIELIEPTGDGGPVRKFLDRPGSSRIYQIRFYTDDLDHTLNEAARRGVRVLRGPDVEGEPRLGFIHPAGTGGALIEVMEVQEKAR